MAVKHKAERVILLPDAKMDYAPEQVEKFIKLWNDGYSLDWITAKMGGIAKYETALLIIHCDLYGLITDRPGGYAGTVKKERKKREMMVIK